ncbi:hypothetical protein DPV93_01095 [Haemophilus sputorum]|uniref:Uncharacterized protein n=1 Tax=Haemophilus sputorum TaxID=1078480 RepID=A0A369YKV6_9PAST|nr:hypothetical protein [Haemophilus sputorum]RDE73784.1 hypothetical protein DPV93_01095 [Haemophilus sputorum]
MENNEQITSPVKSGVKATAIGGLSAFGTQIVKVWYPLGDPTVADYAYRQDFQEMLISGVVFLVPLVIFAITLISSKFLATPEELDTTRRLKKDEKKLKSILLEAQKYPTLYSEGHLNNIRQDLEETQRQLANIGKATMSQN